MGPRKLALIAALAACELAAGTPRSAAERLAFVRENPCPPTGQRRGACPGWEVDHIQPLCAGGPDHRSNMHWLSKEDHRFKTLVDVRECRRTTRANHLTTN
jgi:hypothetical protein